MNENSENFLLIRFSYFPNIGVTVSFLYDVSKITLCYSILPVTIMITLLLACFVVQSSFQRYSEKKPP